MAKAFRIAVAALRVLVVAVCLPVLIASLVLWPRSSYYFDRFEIAVDNQRAKANMSTSSPRIWHTDKVIVVESAGGSLTWRGPGHFRVGGPEIPKPFRVGSLRMRTEMIWSPSITGRYRTLTVQVPYWLSIAAAVAGLVIAVPRRPLYAVSWRFRLSSLLLATLAAAAIVGSYRIGGDGTAVLVGEMILLTVIVQKAWIVLARESGGRRQLAKVILAISLLGLAAIATFAIYLAAWYEMDDLPSHL